MTCQRASPPPRLAALLGLPLRLFRGYSSLCLTLFDIDHSNSLAFFSSPSILHPGSHTSLSSIVILYTAHPSRSLFSSATPCVSRGNAERRNVDSCFAIHPPSFSLSAIFTIAARPSLVVKKREHVELSCNAWNASSAFRERFPYRQQAV